MSNRMLCIGHSMSDVHCGSVSLPAQFVTEAAAFVGKRGSGKTSAATVLVEQMVRNGYPTLVIDPMGVFWGLRSGKNGKPDGGLPVLLLGGRESAVRDMPLEAVAGAAVADFVVAERQPTVLDLSEMNKSEQRRFVTDLCLRLCQKNRDPLHVVMDECDLFIPQRRIHGDEHMIGAVKDLVQRGRNKGLGVSLLSQRPAVVDKDVLCQVEVMFAFRMVGPRDKDAVESWMEARDLSDAQRKDFLQSLPRLPVGTAWMWSPGWLERFEQIHFDARSTFDSSATPKVGAPVKRPPLKEVDLEALKAGFARTFEKAKQEDPKLLRARIADLERQLAAKPTETKTVVERVEVPMFDEAAFKELERTVYDNIALAMNNSRGAMHVYMSKALERAKAKPGAIVGAPRPARTPPPADRLAHGAGQPKPGRTALHPAPAKWTHLGKCERSVLTVLAQRMPALTTDSQAAILSGYSIRSSGFANALSALRTRGLMAGPRNAMHPTPDGVHVLGDFERLPTGGELVNYWMHKLGKCERALLQVLVDSYPHAVPREQLADKSGYSLASSGFANSLSKLRTLELIRGREDMCASEVLFT